MEVCYHDASWVGASHHLVKLIFPRPVSATLIPQLTQLVRSHIYAQLHINKCSS